jgi:quercetin dioxygenase-like cupin family protein
MRTFIAVAVLGYGGLMLAGHEGHGKVTVKTVSEKDIVEKVDGKDSKATTVEVSLEPGQSSPPHRHPGPVFGYILEGEYEWGLNDLPAKLLKVGDTFYEPTGSLHRVSRNPGKTRTRVLAVLVVPRDAKQISIPEPTKK